MIAKNGPDEGQKTLTRADLAEVVYNRIGLPRTECAALVEAILTAISDAAVRGENIKLSSFGTFIVRQKRQRMGRNPKTGEEVPITPRRVMTFRASNVMRGRINGANGKADD
ncbi:MAG: integration host factor subunit alpha [Beijerinckiaceae bacterium]